MLGLFVGLKKEVISIAYERYLLTCLTVSGRKNLSIASGDVNPNYSCDSMGSNPMNQTPRRRQKPVYGSTV